MCTGGSQKRIDGPHGVKYSDDPDERLELITQALQIEARDVPRINLFYMVSNIAYNKDLNCKVCAGLESYNWSEFSWN